MSISEVFNINNMEYMATIPNKFFDLVIADPPYGINMSMGHKGSDKRGDKNKFKKFHGSDSEIPSNEWFIQLARISKNYIIWGANYMIKYLKPTPCFIVWDKQQPQDFSMAMCEIAFTTFKTPAKIYTKRVVGADTERIHPTQKPVDLYRWILTNYAKQGDKIFDPNMGSQSSRIAAYDMGFDYWGCELDKEYFDKGNQRFENFKKQLKLL